MLAQMIYRIVQEHPGRDYRLEKAGRQVWFYTDSAANELVHGRLDQAVKLTLDKNGLPYVIHPLHLAKRMETEAEICTALLHDVVEAVGLLTRRPQEDYLAYNSPPAAGRESDIFLFAAAVSAEHFCITGNEVSC